jgi:branched-chain amino acid aminotransferase
VSRVPERAEDRPRDDMNQGGGQTFGPVGCIDGAIMSAADVRVPATDTGLTRGDGVFEVVRVYGGTPFALEEHLARLARSARAIGLEYSHAALRLECANACERVGSRDCNLRIMVTRGGRRILLEEPITAYPTRARVMLVPHLVTPLLAGVKSLSYAAHCQALRLAKERGCDDALLVHAVTGEVLEGPFASILWVKDQCIFTPPLEAGLLDSITRRVLCEVTDVREATCTDGILSNADEACLVSTTREVQSVGEIVGVRVLGEDQPVVTALAQAYRRYVDAAIGRVAGAVAS